MRKIGALLVTVTLAAGGCVEVMDFQWAAQGISTTGGTAGQGGAGGQGGALFCSPGEIRECYTGPEGTKGQGICKPGEQTCNAEGTAFGLCEGEVPPQTEDCTTIDMDEDCDGSNVCEEDLWARRFGDTQDQFGRAVAVNGADEIAIAGSFAGAIDFGDFFLSAPSTVDAFIAKLDVSGHPIWSRQIGGEGDQSANGVAMDAAGNVVGTGVFEGTIDVAGIALEADGFDSFVAKFGPRGETLWVNTIGGVQSQNISTVGVDSTGNILVAGYFNGTADFGNGLELQSAGNVDAFVAKFDTAGTALWAKAFGDFAEQRATGLAVDASGSVFVTGYFIGQIDLGDGPSSFATSYTAFLAKFDPSGSLSWARVFGGEGNQKATGVAVDAFGNSAVTGDFAGAVDFGGGVEVAESGAFDTFLARFDEGGAYTWSRRFEPTQVRAIAQTADAKTLLCGSFHDVIDFGGGPLTSAGGADVFLAVFEPDGAAVSAHAYGDEEEQQATSAAGTPTGKAILIGDFEGTLDFGTGLLTAAGGRDVFVAKIAP